MLRRAKVKPLLSGSMISDTQWAIDYMETGHIPGTKWTVARWSRAKREVLCDPLEMARYVRQQAPASDAPEWMVILLESLLNLLTVREREAYRLVRGNGYSFAQAGRLMGCNKGSIQNFVQRAEKKIALVVRKQTISEGVICK